MRTAPILARCLPVAVLGTLAFAAGSCASTPVVDVALEDPLDLRETAKYAQLVVFDGGCPDKAKLAEGDVSGNRWMQSVEMGGNFNEIGTLEKGPFGFAAVLRDDRCGVLGFGCTPVDLSHHRHVTVAVNELVSPPRGACDADETCANSVCVSGAPEAGAEADVDAGPLTCELDLVATGSFELPTEVGSLFTGPAVVATPNGFVVMYRRVEPGGVEPMGVRLKLTDQGDATEVEIELPSCGDDIAADGIAGAWNNTFGAGLMAVSLPPCGMDKPRLHVSNFDRDGKTLAEYTYVDLPSRLVLSPVKAMAPAPGAKEFQLAAMAGPAPYLYVFDGLSVQANPPPAEIHKGNGTATFTQISSGSIIRSLLTDSDLESGQLVVSVTDTGSGSSSTSFFERTTVTSLLSWAERTALVQPSASALAWKVITKSGSSVKEGSLTGGPYTAVDAAQLHDYLLIAGAQAGSVTVFRLDDANGTFSGASTFQAKLSSSLGVSAIKDFKGERVAVAAARGRVVVTWLTSVEPVANTTTVPGGWAVLACDG